MQEGDYELVRGTQILTRHDGSIRQAGSSGEVTDPGELVLMFCDIHFQTSGKDPYAGKQKLNNTRVTGLAAWLGRLA